MKNPRFHVYFTPTSASWLNPVEVGSISVERQALYTADVAFVSEIHKCTLAFVTDRDARRRPFASTMTSTDTLNEDNRTTTSETGN